DRAVAPEDDLASDRHRAVVRAQVGLPASLSRALAGRQLLGAASVRAGQARRSWRTGELEVAHAPEELAAIGVDPHARAAGLVETRELHDARAAADVGAHRPCPVGVAADRS